MKVKDGKHSLLILAVLLTVELLYLNEACGESPGAKASSNYQKTDQFLPGEEVVTPTGKKMKVWSTEGPVKVARPPEPFEDREKVVLDGSHLVIDAEAVIKRQQPRTAGSHDSFDTRR